jgi:hypothetical protein
MINLSLASVPDGLAVLCILFALAVGIGFGILTMCLLSLGKENHHGP